MTSDKTTIRRITEAEATVIAYWWASGLVLGAFVWLPLGGAIGWIGWLIDGGILGPLNAGLILWRIF